MPTNLLVNLVKSDIKGFVIRGFGAGNIPSQFLEFLQEAQERRIPVIVSTQCYNGGTAMRLYEVGKQALKYGVIESYDMTLESSITKFMWALKQGYKGERLVRIMHSKFSDEILLK